VLRVLAAVLALAAPLFAPTPSVSDPMPDLIVKSASAILGSGCDVSDPIVIVIAEIANAGDGPSPARSATDTVVATDKGFNWSAGSGLPDIAPGASVTVTIPFVAPSLEGLVGPHTFTVWVNRNRKIAESDYTNDQSKPIKIGIPSKMCASTPTPSASQAPLASPATVVSPAPATTSADSSAPAVSPTPGIP
jgi:hypothetical protein